MPTIKTRFTYTGTGFELIRILFNAKTGPSCSVSASSHFLSVGHQFHPHPAVPVLCLVLSASIDAPILGRWCHPNHSNVKCRNSFAPFSISAIRGLGVSLQPKNTQTSAREEANDPQMRPFPECPVLQMSECFSPTASNVRSESLIHANINQILTKY